jgi:hypothetical protein
MAGEPPDMSAMFNTTLTPQEEQAFQSWAAQTKRTNDLFDYDLRGAWKANAQEAANGHLPDTYKKPNHPTFSAESMYSGQGGMTGGQWMQTRHGWKFVASHSNLDFFTPRELQGYFKRNEPDAILVLPGGGR